MRKLAIITSHPIQYNAPLFTLLAERKRIHIKVFYTWGQSKEAIYDPQFGNMREWDIPLLQDYDYSFIHNTAKKPGSHHFFGIQNPTLIREVKDWGAHAILIFGWAFQSHLATMRHFSGRLPIFFRGDSTLLDEKPGMKKLARGLLLRWVYRHVTRAFYVGHNNKAYFSKYGLANEQLVYAPHAVDNFRFGAITNEQEAEVNQWRTEIGIKDNDFVVLFAGKLETKKNPLFILDLAKRLSRDNVKFLLVGNGELEESLKINTRGKQVLFLPFQNQSKMPLVYRLGDVFLLPSKGPGETWGLAVNEAMACGLPVILSNKVGCAPDLVGDKDTGLAFSPCDVDRVAGYICNLQKDRASYRQTSENARHHILSFNFERVAEAIEREMQKVAAN